jgi:hypothetical protein
MSTEAPATVVEPGGHYESATHGGLTVSSNTETSEQIQATLEAEDHPESETQTEPAKEAKGPERGADGRYLPKDGKPKEVEAKEVEEPDEEEPVAAKEGDKPLGKPRDDPRARMLEATRESAALKREKAALEAELRAVRSTPRPEPQPQPQRQAQPTPDEPKAENYGTYEEYVKAQARYEARQEVRGLQQEIQNQTRVAQFAQNIERTAHNFSQRVQAFEGKNPGFMEKASGLVSQLTPSVLMPAGSPIGPHNALADELLNNEHSAEIINHLVEHEDDLQRFATLRTAREVWQAVARIEARLELQAQAAASAGTAPKPVSQARPPVRPVTGGKASSVATELSDDLSDEDFMRAARKQKRLR